jgi:hypothetical protein
MGFYWAENDRVTVRSYSGTQEAKPTPKAFANSLISHKEILDFGFGARFKKRE